MAKRHNSMVLQSSCHFYVLEIVRLLYHKSAIRSIKNLCNQNSFKFYVKYGNKYFTTGSACDMIEEKEKSVIDCGEVWNRRMESHYWR